MNRRYLPGVVYSNRIKPKACIKEPTFTHITTTNGGRGDTLVRRFGGEKFPCWPIFSPFYKQNHTSRTFYFFTNVSESVTRALYDSFGKRCVDSFYEIVRLNIDEFANTSKRLGCQSQRRNKPISLKFPLIFSAI